MNNPNYCHSTPYYYIKHQIHKTCLYPIDKENGQEDPSPFLLPFCYHNKPEQAVTGWKTLLKKRLFFLLLLSLVRGIQTTANL